jgi:electron transport complex protein RnfE
VIATTDPPTSAMAAFWRRNWPLVQLVGLTPLLVVTTSVVKGLALGVLTTLTLAIAGVLTAAVAPALLPRTRAPFHVLVAAVAVTCLDWLLHATLYDLHGALGIVLPLIVVNAGLLAEAETFNQRRSIGHALLGALAAGTGFTAVLAGLGALRELVGQGTLFADLSLLGVQGTSWLTVRLPFDGVQVALLPPGALFGMALLLALRQHYARRVRATSQ